MDNGKRGVVIAAIALVAVLVAAVVGYNVLRGHAQGQSQTSGTTTTAENGSSSASQTEAGPQLADYDATVYTNLGEPILLSEIADGKPLVMNFWATWCPYCVQEMSDYQQLYHLYGNRVSFAFIDCDYGRGETREGALAWLTDNGYADLPAYFDTGKEASMNFGASSLPTTVIVSGEGEIISLSTGAIDAGRMDAVLSSLVS